jgi:hypothetical protein
MHLDVSRIEERIHKLQEVKRIANDSELLSMITEFIVMNDRAADPVPAPKVPVAVAASTGAPRPEDTDVVNQLMKDMDPTGGSSIWARARAGKGA